MDSELYSAAGGALQKMPVIIKVKGSDTGIKQETTK